MNLIFRVLLGYLLACLAAGLTTILFAWTPSDLAGMQGDMANDKLALAMPVATHIALFAAPFALAAIGFGEARRQRDWAYYAVAGMLIALLGYIAQYQSEHPGATWSVTASNYPLIGFLTSGFAGGLVYWLFSGRMAALGSPSAQVRAPGTNNINNKTTGTGARPAGSR